MDNPNKSLQHLEEVESLGEEILTDRSEIVALDKRRQDNREGLRALSKCTDKKTWMALGPLLIKLPKEKAQDLMQKDQVQVDAEINKLRSNLKVKVNNLRDLEHQNPVPGLMLNALSPAEMNAVGQIIGRHSN